MWLDSLGVKTVDEAAAKLAPLTDDVMSRLRGTIYESLERFNGATWELSISGDKLVIQMKLPPVSPPATNLPEGFRG